LYKILIMKIIDLSPRHERQYFCCLEEWSPEIIDAGNHKECWYSKMKDKGLRVKIAENDKGEAAGMIQYLPVEVSPVVGHDMYYVLCIWVHGHKQGIGNFQNRGIGKALLRAAEEDARHQGAKALITWGIVFPFFMRVSWFKKQGYKIADKSGMTRLLWKTFSEEAEPPKFMKKRPLPRQDPGKVNVTVFTNGWCPAQNMVYDRVKKAVMEFREKIDFNVYRTSHLDIMRYWGIADALFINGKEIWTGPPPSYRKIFKIIEKRVHKLKEPIEA
jgi:predicted N-acetyltransferase YhbS